MGDISNTPIFEEKADDEDILTGFDRMHSQNVKSMVIHSNHSMDVSSDSLTLSPNWMEEEEEHKNEEEESSEITFSDDDEEENDDDHNDVTIPLGVQIMREREKK